MKKLGSFYIRLFSIVMLSVFFIACSNEEEEVVPVIEKPVDGLDPLEPVGDANHMVYATFDESINDVWVAKVLTACGPISLSDGTRDAGTTGLAIAGFDFYISGYEKNENEVFQAKYWKNSESIWLTDGEEVSSAEDIVVVDDNVYVAGYIGSRAVYWKNGEVFYLSDEKSKCVATCIFVSGSDVYVGGAMKNSEDKYEAVYWVNGEEEKPAGTCVYSIFVKGSDVYVTGQFGTTFKYLKNSTWVSLNEGSKGGGTNSIFVNEDDEVYVAAPGVIWNQGERTGVTKDGKELSFAFLKVLDGYMYGGTMYSNGSKYVAAIWKNGEIINITDGTNNAGVTDVEIVKM